MKKKLILIFILILSINFLSCKKIEKENKELTFEKKVFQEIFPLLSSQVQKDTRKKIITIQPMPILDKEGNLIGKDSSVYFNSLLRNKELMTKLKNDESKIVVALGDTIFNLKKEDWKPFKTYLMSKKSDFYDSIQEKKQNYKLNISELKKDSILEFKYLSEFPKGTKIWKKKYSFHLNGTMNFSRIYFSKNKKFGMLVYGVLEGKLSGGIMRCFIKKENGKWSIEKEELLVVS
jgi:hypothetical protein